MAIFKRNRNRKNGTIVPEENITSPVSPSGEAARTAESKEHEDGMRPVLSFGEQLAVSEPVQPEKSAAEEMEGEISSIADIFDATQAPKEPAKPSAEVQAAKGRWFKRRERAMATVDISDKTDDGAEATVVSAPAPVVQPMRAVTEQKKRRERERPLNPVSLAFADLSSRTDLEPEEIEDASDIYGIKYPAGFDTSMVDYTGRAIDFSNFSLVEGLRWAHIEGASDISGVVFPSSFDIEGANFFGRNLRSCDFSAVYALKWRHIEAADDIVAVKYPVTFDIDNADFSQRNISGSDFSLVAGLRYSHIESAADISGIRYPSQFSLEGVSFAGRDISRSDFSLCNGLRWENIKDAAAIKGIIYPADFDIENADFSGRDISGSDFTRLDSFEFDYICAAADIRKIKYPECYDSARAKYAELNISGSNFSRVSSLRWAHICKAADLTRLIYPPAFDIANADFTGRNIDYSDFSLLPSFEWKSVRFAESRENLVFPSSFDEPRPSDDEIQGAMLIYLLRLYNREYKGNLEISRFYEDISALYPGVDDARAAALIDSATAVWEQPDGKLITEFAAREAHVGDKLFIVKLGFKLLYPNHETAVTEKLLRENLGRIFKPSERDRFEKRLSDLFKGKYLSASELAAIGFEPAVSQKTELKVEVTEQQPEPVSEPVYVAEPESVLESEPAAAPESAKDEQNGSGEQSRVYTFGQVDVSTIKIDPSMTREDLMPAQEDERIGAEPIIRHTDKHEPEKVPEPAVQTASEPEPQPQAIVPTPIEEFVAKPVDIDKLRRQKAAKPAAPKREKLTDEEKAIRTGVMGMLLYIHQNTSDEPMSNSELFSEFMKLYPGAVPKEAAAMAKFAADTLAGTDTATRSKLFMFAARASASVKRKLLDFSYNEYIYKISETADEQMFRDFLLALCSTLYDDSPEYEYSSYLRSRDILKDPPLKREPGYKRIPFENNIGKANLYANDQYPYYRTLQQVGFQNCSFEAIKGNLLIELSDNKYYEELENLVFRIGDPELLQFVVIETQMGYLYLEKRCVDDWNVSLEEVWEAAERNMEQTGMKPRYSFASSECASFRYIQHSLASYALCKPELLDEMARGRDLIIAVPCREIVYVDFYDFTGVKKLLEFIARYDCALNINGDEYEHPFSADVFIYHHEEKTLERVNDETYILLGDSVSRRQVLRSVLPLNIDITPEQLVTPKKTDEVAAPTEEICLIQEAVYTLLRIYTEINGETDYTLAQNAFMAVVDEVYISFDCSFPPARGREQFDAMDHIDEAVQMAMRGGKTMCWLIVQALQHLCGDVKYETPSAAGLRNDILTAIYNDNANAVWLNCATASDFAKRFEAQKRVHEVMVANQHLTILDSRLEVAMHVLVMLYHQYARRYALEQVRYRLTDALPSVVFSYEINQSAWLPSPGEDIDVDAQSLGMVFRGFDRATQERMLSTFAAAIGDRDLAEGGWPLLYFIKFVKYAYLDPVEMVEKYFAERSRLIPSQTVLKQLYYKDLNNEFVKHSRMAGVEQERYDDAFESRAVTTDNLMRSVENFEDLAGDIVLADYSEPVKPPTAESSPAAYQKPDIQLRAVEESYLENRLSFILEEVNEQIAGSLRDAAHYVTKLYHVPEIDFKATDDLECELHNGIIRTREQITTLRSFAWTMFELMRSENREMQDVTQGDIIRVVDILEDHNRINYKSNSHFPVLCSMPLDSGMYVNCYQEYIFFAQELLPEVQLASLFSLQEELRALAPSIKLIFDMLRAEQRSDTFVPRGLLSDTLATWSAFCFSCAQPFEVAEGPAVYNFSQIKR